MLTQSSFDAKVDYTFRKMAYHHPFYIHSLSNIPIIQEDKINPDAFASWDGKKIRIYSPIADTLEDAEFAGLIEHEHDHCLGLHLERMGSRNIRLWNIACDYKINGDISRGPVHDIRMPEWTLFDPKFSNAPEMDCEEIYSLLENTPKGKKIIEDYDKGKQSTVDGKPYEGEFEEIQDIPQAIEQAQDILRQTLMQFGDSGANLPIAVQEILKPTVNWRMHLRKFLTSFSKGYSYEHGDRHYPTVFLPDFVDVESTLEIGVALDMSGSIKDIHRAKFLGEVQAIASKFPQVKMRVYTFDVDSYFIGEVSSVSDVNSAFRNLVGGGGTSFVSVIDRASRDRVSGLIVFTDTHGTFPKHKPRYPILWLDVAPKKDKKPPPWGKVVPCEAV
jgi:predicted metal-dependent peptidase